MAIAVEFGLVEPFDNDTLDFALGVEWAMFRARLLAGGMFSQLCLAENATRLSDLAGRHDRFCEHSPVCGGWHRIFIGGLKSSASREPESK